MFNKITNLLASREVGEYPISIPTSIVLEAIFNNGDMFYPEDIKPPNRPNPSNYDYHYFSIPTMIRNLISSVGVKEISEIQRNPTTVAETVLEETDVIRELYQGTSCKPIFYTHGHRSVLKDTNPNLEFRRIRGQLLVVESTIKQITSKVINEDLEDHLLVMNSFKKNNAKILITTHYPVELLERDKFSEMSLIESHTGSFKPFWLLYTKYAHYKEDPRYSLLPWNKLLLYLLGDKIQIKPKPKELRLKVLTMAERKNFTPRTSNSKVMLNLRQLGIKLF